MLCHDFPALILFRFCTKCLILRYRDTYAHGIAFEHENEEFRGGGEPKRRGGTLNIPYRQRGTFDTGAH